MWHEQFYCTPTTSQQCHLMVQACPLICLPFPGTATRWQKHACSCISCVRAPTYCDSKSPVPIIGMAAESQQCHTAPQTHLFMPAMSRGHRMVAWKCLHEPAWSQGCHLAGSMSIVVGAGVHLSTDVWQPGTPVHGSAVARHSHLAAPAGLSSLAISQQCPMM